MKPKGTLSQVGDFIFLFLPFSSTNCLTILNILVWPIETKQSILPGLFVSLLATKVFDGSLNIWVWPIETKIKT